MRTFLSHQRAAFVALALFAVLGILSACTVTISVDPALFNRSGGWKFDGFPTGQPPAELKTIFTGMTAVFNGSGTSGTVIFTPTPAAATAAGFTVSGVKFDGKWTMNDTRTRITFTETGLIDTDFLVTELSANTLRLTTNLNINGTVTSVEYKFVGN